MQEAAFSCGLPLIHRQEDCMRCGLTGQYGRLVPEAGVCSLCTMSVEKRIRAEQAWRQQKAFQASLFRFQDWLWAAEVTAASANSSQVTYANSKQELRRFEPLPSVYLGNYAPHMTADLVSTKEVEDVYLAVRELQGDCEATVSNAAIAAIEQLFQYCGNRISRHLIPHQFMPVLKSSLEKENAEERK